jgi:hypothetical protein
MELDGRPYRGHDEIRTIFTGAADLVRQPTGPILVRHHTSTLQIDVASGTDATSRCYYQVLSGTGLDHWGRYLDRYGVIDGRWYFVHRREFLDGFVPDSWTRSGTSQ